VVVVGSVVLGTAVIFFVLWKAGVLDDFRGGNLFGGGGSDGPPPDDSDPLPPDPNERERLKPFEKFLEDLTRSQRERED